MYNISESKYDFFIGTPKEIKEKWEELVDEGYMPSHLGEPKFNEKRMYGLSVDYYDLDGRYLNAPTIMVCRAPFTKEEEELLATISDPERREAMAVDAFVREYKIGMERDDLQEEYDEYEEKYEEPELSKEEKERLGKQIGRSNYYKTEQVDYYENGFTSRVFRDGREHMLVIEIGDRLADGNILTRENLNLLIEQSKSSDGWESYIDEREVDEPELSYEDIMQEVDFSKPETFDREISEPGKDLDEINYEEIELITEPEFADREPEKKVLSLKDREERSFDDIYEDMLAEDVRKSDEPQKEEKIFDKNRSKQEPELYESIFEQGLTGGTAAAAVSLFGQFEVQPTRVEVRHSGEKRNFNDIMSYANNLHNKERLDRISDMADDIPNTTNFTIKDEHGCDYIYVHKDVNGNLSMTTVNGEKLDKHDLRKVCEKNPDHYYRQIVTRTKSYKEVKERNERDDRGEMERVR